MNRDTRDPSDPSAGVAFVAWWFTGMLVIEPMFAYVAAALFFGLGTWEWVRWCRHADSSTSEESK